MMQTLRQKYLNACLGGDIGTIAHMIKTEDLNFRNSKFLVECLKSACSGNHIEVCKIILGHRNTLTKFSSEDTIEIILDSCRFGNLSIYQFYLSKLGHHNFLQLEFLYAACESGNIILVRYILNNNIDFWHILSVNHSICCACRSGNIEIVNLIISYEGGILFTTYDAEGGNNLNSSLYAACDAKPDDTYKDNIEIAELMIKKGATSFEGCMHVACYNGNKKTINFLIECGVTDWNEGLYGACHEGHMDIVHYMIEKGATNWEAAMCNACQGGHLDIVELMISKGANYWNGCLNWACYWNSVEIIKFMITKGATEFDECLKYACLYGHVDFVKISIEKGSTNWNEGLLMACQGGHIELIQLMLDHGATDLNGGLLKNHTHNTHIYTLLITRGADDLTGLNGTRDFRLLYMYNKFLGPPRNNYMDLLPEYPPCVLFVGGRLSKNNRGRHMKRLPVELFKMLVQYC